MLIDDGLIATTPRATLKLNDVVEIELLCLKYSRKLPSELDVGRAVEVWRWAV